MQEGTTEWLEATARRVIDAQLGEAARLDEKARELLGFIGIVLALLAAAASQSGSISGFWGYVYYGAAITSVVLLALAALRSVQQIVEPAAFQDIGASAVAEYKNDPALPGVTLEEVQTQAFSDLSEAAEENVTLIAVAQERLAAAYGVFSLALSASGVAVVALVLSLL